jgi:hypothetical protein
MGSLFLDRYLKPRPPSYEAQELSSGPRPTVTDHCFQKEILMIMKEQKKMENLSPNNWFPCRGLNPRPSEYAEMVLSSRLRHSMTDNCLLTEIFIRVMTAKSFACEQYPWLQSTIKDVDNWMVKGYCHDFSWKTCHVVRSWPFQFAVTQSLHVRQTEMCSVASSTWVCCV